MIHKQIESQVILNASTTYERLNSVRWLDYHPFLMLYYEMIDVSCQICILHCVHPIKRPVFLESISYFPDIIYFEMLIDISHLCDIISLFVFCVPD